MAELCEDAGLVRHDWTHESVGALFALPFPELMFRAQAAHRRHFDPARVQLSTLLSIKTGGCPEDCAYCPQSVHYDTGVGASKLMDVGAVVAAAARAQAAGASRFCMGAAWREPKDRDLDAVCAMVEGVARLGLESCATLGMLTAPQAGRLKAAGLDYYNHNLDTSPEHYARIITTRTYRDRLDTLAHVRAAGIKVCCGGIVGMGESRADRVGMIVTLATLPEHPESVPINLLVRVAGTPLADASPLDALEFVRTIAVARVTLGRTRGHERRDPGAVLPRRRQLDLLRAAPPHHTQSRARSRPGAARSARPRALKISRWRRRSRRLPPPSPAPSWQCRRDRGCGARSRR
jgi:biotin synthase